MVARMFSLPAYRVCSSMMVKLAVCVLLILAITHNRGLTAVRADPASSRPSSSSSSPEAPPRPNIGGNRGSDSGANRAGPPAIPSASTTSSINAKPSPVGIPLLTSWMKDLSDRFKMAGRYRMVEVLQRTPSEMVSQWKRRRTGGAQKSVEKGGAKATVPFSSRPKLQQQSADESSGTGSTATHLLLDSAESVLHQVGDGTVTQEDIEALEDFGLQVASFSIVVIVAAMFGAFLSWLFRIAYIKWRRRLVARLPIVRYLGPGWEAVPISQGAKRGAVPRSPSSSSSSIAEVSEEEERQIQLRAAVEQSLTQLAVSVTSGADPEVIAFLRYLSTNATHVFDELQSLSHHAVDIANTVLRREDCHISASTSSSLSASSAAVLLLQWDLRRLVAAAGIIVSEYEAFLQTPAASRSRSGSLEKKSKRPVVSSGGRIEIHKSEPVAPRSEFTAVLSRLRQSLVQYRNALVVSAADASLSHHNHDHDGDDAERLALIDRNGVLSPRPPVASAGASGAGAGGEEEQAGAAFCPVCMDKFARGESLSQLPCRHLYHTRCIVPWLMKQSLTCPLCKQIGACPRQTCRIMTDALIM